MATFDLLLKNGTVVFPAGEKKVDIAVSEGKIVEINPSINGTATETIDASGLHIFPGMIDAHVHFNDPGRTDWETITNGSSALAAGGGVGFFDMPLNSEPLVLDAKSYNAKLAEAKTKSLVDYGLWGGLTPKSVPNLEELAECGVIGFKAFNCHSGLDDFPGVDDWSIYKGMEIAAKLGMLVCIHCENDLITAKMFQEALAAGKSTAREFLDSRPAFTETESIQRMVAFAEETGCALHIAHVSTARGVQICTEARARGVNVTCETLPSYLVFTDKDVERIGTLAKCCPPPRDGDNREKLWQRVFNDEVVLVGSDHSPATAELKINDNFFKAWGGISGVQTTLNALLTEGYHNRQFPLAKIAALTSSNVVDRFKVKGKGKIEVNYDADFAIVDLNKEFTLKNEDLFYKNKISAYVGQHYKGKVVQTILRGTTVFKDGKITSKPIGQQIKPVL